MQNTLRFGISALALSAALGMAAPAMAAHHGGGWVPSGGGSAPAGGGSSSSGGGGGSAPSWTPGGGGSSSGNSGGSAPHVNAWHPASGAAAHVAHPHVFTSGQNFAHFNTTQRAAWSHGHWWHGHHHGHDGWWWFASGGWFFYPAAVYPYPDYVSNEADYGDAYYGGPQNNTWWYCASPAGYYPYVQNCMTPWRPVSPAPPPPGPGGTGGYGAPPDSGDQYGPPPDGGPDSGGPPPDNGPDNGPPPPPPGH